MGKQAVEDWDVVEASMTTHVMADGSFMSWCGAVTADPADPGSDTRFSAFPDTTCRYCLQGEIERGTYTYWKTQAVDQLARLNRG